MDVRCAACGSARLLNQTRLVTRYQHAPNEVVLHTQPSGPLGIVQFKSEVRGRTCVDCGHVQFHAVSRDELLLAYERQENGLVKFDG